MRVLLIVSLLLTVCYKESDWEVCDDNNVINGYWWRGYWVPGLPTYETQFLELPPLMSGIAVFYGPNVMEGTARYRGLSLDGYLGGVALPTCSFIGSPVWIKRDTWEGPYLVVDCARRNDLYGVAVIRKEVVEVDFPTAVRWGMAEQHADYSWNVLKWNEDVLVSQFPPACIPKEAVDLSTWIEPRIEYVPWLDEITSLYIPPSTWRVGWEWKTFNNDRVCDLP